MTEIQIKWCRWSGETLGLFLWREIGLTSWPTNQKKVLTCNTYLWPRELKRVGLDKKRSFRLIMTFYLNDLTSVLKILRSVFPLASFLSKRVHLCQMQRLLPVSGSVRAAWCSLCGNPVITAKRWFLSCCTSRPGSPQSCEASVASVWTETVHSRCLSLV